MRTTSLAKIAEFLKVRDENVLPEETSDAERLATANEILDMVDLDAVTELRRFHDERSYVVGVNDGYEAAQEHFEKAAPGGMPAAGVEADVLFEMVRQAFVRGDSWRLRNRIRTPEGFEAEAAKAAYDYADAVTSALPASPSPSVEAGEVEAVAWRRDDLAMGLAYLDGIRLLDIKASVGPEDDANHWRKYLSRADDLLAYLSAAASNGGLS